MKTDLDRTKEFLDSLGVYYKERVVDLSNEIPDGNGGYRIEYKQLDKGLGVPEANGLTFVWFRFNDLGKFKSVGAWE